MNNLYNSTHVSGILERIEKLSPNSQRQWGKMNVAQMLAHCNVSLETALGKNVIPRVPFVSQLIAKMLRPSVMGPKPFGKNSPTDKSYIMKAELNFDEQKSKAVSSIKKFSEGGPSACTTHPHPFFGHFTPEEWALFQWKHLDHHLRQFGV
jgi:hypothetical protein